MKNRNTAATPYWENNLPFLLTERWDNVSTRIELEDNNSKGTQYTIQLDSTKDTVKLQLTDTAQRKIIEELYQRRAQINILSKTGYRVINKSPNVYYDTNPIFSEEDMENDIVAYQRYYIFTEYFEGKGLGFGVDIGTSYFSKFSVEKYFTNGLEERFYQLKERQSTEYKGTLLYKGPNGYSRCYFDRYERDLTLETTNPFTFRGKNYLNSFDYFKQLYPDFSVLPTDKVAFVSFKGLGTYPVPAKNLFLAVATDNLTDDINQQDKYSAQQKRNLIDDFWKKVNDPFGRNYQKLQQSYYSPGTKGGTFELPTIMYADNHQLLPPKHKHAYLYKKYFINKYHKLKENGCFYVPPMLERDMHFMLPTSVKNNIQTQLVEDLAKDVAHLTKKNIEPIEHQYETNNYLSAIYDLKANYDKGTVVFVFDNNEPSIYYNISHELKGWKIVRMTKQELQRKFYKLQSSNPRGKGHWETYISLNAFKVVSELGCIPYMFEEKLNYIQISA